MKIGKLTVQQVIELAKDLEENVYGGRGNAFSEDERLYDLDFKNDLHIPNEFVKDVLVLSTGRDMVDTFCNHTNITHASVKATRKGTSKKTDDEVNAERHFGAGVIYMTNKDSEVSPWWDCAKHYWEHGMGVLKQVYVGDLWPNKPRQKKGESDEAYQERLDEWLGETGKSFPIKVMAVHPNNVYPDPDPRSTDFVVEINHYNYLKAHMRYPFWENLEGRSVSDPNVRHISFWSATQHMEIVDGQSVIRTRTGIDNHGYGIIPYVIFNSGLGSITSDYDMAKRYVGLLRYVKDLLIAESSVFSVNHVVLKKAGWPGAILKGENASQVKFKEGYGVLNTIPEGVEFVEYQHKVSPPEILNEFAMLHSLLSEHGASRSMMGMGEEGVRSGSDRRLLLAEGTTRLGQSIQTFQDRTSKVLENCAKIFVNAVPGNVRVWSRDAIPSIDEVIDKKKMKEPFNYTVEFSPVSWEDEYRRNDNRVMLLSSGVYTRDKVWEDMPGVDADDMAERLEWQRLMDSPAINQTIDGAMGMLTQSILAKRMGSDELLEAMNAPEVEVNQEQQQPPGVGQMTNNIYDRGQQQGMPTRNPTRPLQGMGGGGERGAFR